MIYEVLINVGHIKKRAIARLVKSGFHTVFEGLYGFPKVTGFAEHLSAFYDR